MLTLWRKKFRYLIRSIQFVLLAFLLMVLIDQWISWKTERHIITDINNVPRFQVAMVLGTSKYIGRTLNEYYSHRMESAIYLYRQGKIDNFLLSGDNAHRNYNEPWTMKRDLMKAGIPEERITLDYAGFRTLDSIVRAKKVFNSNHFLIITQRFHCERALYIAQHHSINATCLAVPGPLHQTGFKVRFREIFARTKAILDLYILDMKPKFLGPEEPIISKKTENKDPQTESSAEENTKNKDGE